MNTELVVKRESGVSYRIFVDVRFDPYESGVVHYRVSVGFKGKGKRKWFSIDKDIPEYEYRGMSLDERREYDNGNILRFVTKDEVNKAKLKLWNLMKPKID